MKRTGGEPWLSAESWNLRRVNPVRFSAAARKSLPFLVADEIDRQLGRAQLHPHPFAGRFAFLLEGGPGHQLHRLVAGHSADVEALVEDRIDRQAHLELVMGEQIARVAIEVTGVGHHVLAVARPAFDHRTGLEERAQPRLVEIGVRDLQQVAGHCLVQCQLLHHPLIVFAQVGGRLFRRPIRRDRLDDVEAALVALERARHVGVGHRPCRAHIRASR